MKLKEILKRVVAGVLVAGVLSMSITACSVKKETTTVESQDSSQVVSESSSDAAEPVEQETFSVEGKDVFGDDLTSQYFKDHELTMVNLFSVTCNPCMAELPDIFEIAGEMKDKGFAFLALSSDIAEDGNLDPDALEIIKELVGQDKDNVKAMYPGMDATLDLLTKSGNMIPYTFFVDKEGNIVGEDYLGGKSGDEWREVINKHFEMLEQ